MRPLLVAAVLLPTAAFAAEQPAGAPAIGQVVSPVRVFLLEGGSATLQFDSPVVLNNGRVFEQKDGQWRELVPPPVVAPEKVAPLDWVVMSERYVGRRITVPGVRLLSADAEKSMAALPGAYAWVNLAGIPPETLRYLLANCTSIVTGATCTFDVTGVAGRKDATTLTIQQVSLDRPGLAKTTLSVP